MVLFGNLDHTRRHLGGEDSQTGQTSAAAVTRTFPEAAPAPRAASPLNVQNIFEPAVT